MFKSIQLFINDFIEQSSEENEISEQQLQIAAAALLVEMMLIDNQQYSSEKALILNQLSSSFDLSKEMAEELLALAEQQLQNSTDYFQFTSFINKGYDQREKVRLIEYLWQVAFADGQLDEHEEYLVRKVADLLHVPHIQMIKARNIAKTEQVG